MRPLVIWNYGCIRIEVVNDQTYYAEIQCPLSINLKSSHESQTEQLQMLNSFLVWGKSESIVSSFMSWESRNAPDGAPTQHSTKFNLLENAASLISKRFLYTSLIPKQFLFTGPIHVSSNWWLSRVELVKENGRVWWRWESKDQHGFKSTGYPSRWLLSPNSASVPLSPSMVKWSNLK